VSLREQLSDVSEGKLLLRVLTLGTLAALSGVGCGGSNGPPGASGGSPGQGDASVGTGGAASPVPVDASEEPGLHPQTDAGPGEASGGQQIDAALARDSGTAEGGGALPGPCKFMFCESFEDTAAGRPPNAAIWTRTSNDILVDTTRAAHGGQKALHIPALTAGAKYIRENMTISAMGKSFYQRVFLWIEQQPVEKPASLYHWTLLSADELDDYNAGKVIRLGGHVDTTGSNWMRFNFQTHGMPGETGLSDTKMLLAAKRWYCVELYVSLPDNEARVWVDGVEDPNLHWKGPLNGYTFPAAVKWMTFGWAEYQAVATPWEIWIDEIAIDTKRIGCD
jgi:hypothetical protein